MQGKVAPTDVAAWKRLSQDEFRIALQHILETNFALKTHMEQKTASVLTLVLVHGDAARLEKHRVTEQSAKASAMEAYPGSIDFGDASLDTLCTILSSQMRRKVINKTDVAGEFQFKLRYAPIDEEGKSGNAENDSLPSLFEVLKAEYGLQMVEHKESIPILVMDHVEIPQIP